MANWINKVKALRGQWDIMKELGPERFNNIVRKIEKEQQQRKLEKNKKKQNAKIKSYDQLLRQTKVR